MKPIRTYEVAVAGFSPGKYSARSPGKARARAWSEYASTFNATSFKDFMRISRVSRVADPPGCGERIIVNGQTVTRIFHPLMGAGSVYFMRDDSDGVFNAHPLDVSSPQDQEASING